MTARELQLPSPLGAAAWVPSNDPQRFGHEGADLAAQWIRERGRIEGTAPVVVTSALSIALPKALRGIAGQGGRSVPHIPGRCPPGPVVAYVPDARTLRHAMALARGRSVVAIEGCHSLARWAAAVRAVNLLDRPIAAGTLPAGILADLRTVFIGGNDWSAVRQQEHSRRRLAGHLRSGALSPHDAVKYAVSLGVPVRDARRLQAQLIWADVNRRVPFG